MKTGRGNGFKFQDYSVTALVQKVEEAVTLYRQNPRAWRKVMMNAMQADFSWKKSARRYVELYRVAQAQDGGV
ncbi:MAG: hypothetical protein D6736_17560 [Nitrospinota bacterium]|nr:MAG: hypothetical protein D6736_17560 [Nitrospinota bacterium]